MRKILVLRGGALGDFIVTLPALALLRTRWPEAKIELIGNATAAALARNRGLIDRVHSQHEARWSALFGAEPPPPALAAWLDEFDLVVNYWPDPDGALARRFPRHARQRYLSAAALPLRAPAATHYCEPLRELGIEPASFIFPLGTLGSATTRSIPRIALHPGSGSPRKNWPQDRWLELIARLERPLLLVVGEVERERWSEVSEAGFASRVRVLTQPPLETLVAELSSCRLFLGHDSGISHLAAACGVPCVLLFGPTDPATWAPPAPHVRVLRNGADLAAISVDEVLAAIA